MTTQTPGADAPDQQPGTSQQGGSRTVLEWIDVAGDQLLSTVRQLVADGSVRRVVLRDSSGHELLSIPLTAGAVVGGVTVLAAPVLAAVGVIAAMVTRVTLEVERTDADPEADAAAPGAGGGEGGAVPSADAAPAPAMPLPLPPGETRADEVSPTEGGTDEAGEVEAAGKEDCWLPARGVPGTAKPGAGLSEVSEPVQAGVEGHSPRS